MTAKNDRMRNRDMFTYGGCHSLVERGLVSPTTKSRCRKLTGEVWLWRRHSELSQHSDVSPMQILQPKQLSFTKRVATVQRASKPCQYRHLARYFAFLADPEFSYVTPQPCPIFLCALKESPAPEQELAVRQQLPYPHFSNFSKSKESRP